ncbi:hypothetical protein QBC33DRAFT_622894 [Phialemonium atrogriseum]|uniref:Uncharacterized protein n=1 Tax=Phialemonium atrogriseum TaxID=1093897 RepID=A0AAJ0BS46_9PEZI|nr:uncharacterized protein QBC33DRAFT_622894 [Phialemonium atrogriseum]KAK1763475.1 hypothetical protein QBC33DRAFT_622894 [Phialemonium atrogriseum]
MKGRGLPPIKAPTLAPSLCISKAPKKIGAVSHPVEYLLGRRKRPLLDANVEMLWNLTFSRTGRYPHVRGLSRQMQGTRSEEVDGTCHQLPSSHCESLGPRPPSVDMPTVPYYDQIHSLGGTCLDLVDKHPIAVPRIPNALIDYASILISNPRPAKLLKKVLPRIKLQVSDSSVFQILPVIVQGSATSLAASSVSVKPSSVSVKPSSVSVKPTGGVYGMHVRQRRCSEVRISVRWEQRAGPTLGRPRQKTRRCGHALKDRPTAKHDDGEWQALPEDIRVSVYKQPPITFPDLKDLTIRILTAVVDGKLPGSRSFPYREEIQAHGGVDLVADDLLRLMRPEVKDLQGQRVTREALDSIRLNQHEPWPTHIGYLDYVTDDRNDEYIRPYSGQTNKGPRRIIVQHAQSILLNKSNSLHYFVIWVGNGHRQANFIMLWSALPQDWNDWMQLRFNMLEAIFCSAFQSHHGCLALPDELPDHANLGCGLNMISPLMQSAKTSELKKLRHVGALGNSKDPQIQACQSHRARTQNERLRVRPQTPWTRGAYEDALQQAVGPDLFPAIKESLEAPIKEPQSEPRYLDPRMFCGNLSAPVGFVLDYGITARETDIGHPHPNESSQPTVKLPWALEGSGLEDTNVLVWTFDFELFSGLPPADLSTSQASDSSVIHKWHRAILDPSQLNIVLLCGPRAESNILAVEECKQRYTLTIRGFTYRLYIGGGNTAKRLYIRCPELPLQSWSVDMYHAGRVAEAIKFATMMAGLKNPSAPYFVEGSTVLGFILRRSRFERLGCPKMTAETLDPGLRIWLARKGFPEDDGPPRKSPGQPRDPGSNNRQPPYDTICQAAKLFCQEQLQQREAGFEKRKEEVLDSTISDSSLEPGGKPAKRHCPDERAAIDSTTTHEPTPSTPPRELITTVSDFVALPTDMPALLTNVVELASEQKNDFLAALSQQASSGDLEQLDCAMTVSDFPVSDLKYLAPLMGLDDGSVTTAENTGIDDASLEDQDLAVPSPFQLRQALFQPPRKNRGGPLKKVTDWHKERGNFLEKKYAFNVADKNGQGYIKRISICYCFIFIPPDLDAGDGKLHVSIEACEEPDRHPEAYAEGATDADIAKRLAFKVTGHDSKGNEFEFFPKIRGDDAVFRVNSFADILLLGKSRDAIADTPRRYLFYRRGTAPRGMEKFEGGGFTSRVA